LVHCVHPVLTDGYLAAIDRLPIDHPVNWRAPSPETKNPSLPDELGIWATADLVLRGTDGAFVSLGVLRSSGLDEFDAAVLESFERAAPFAPRRSVMPFRSAVSPRPALTPRRYDWLVRNA
jgi:hypothetical protein